MDGYAPTGLFSGFCKSDRCLGVGGLCIYAVWGPKFLEGKEKKSPMIGLFNGKTITFSVVSVPCELA